MKTKRILAVLLCFVMLFAMVPVSAAPVEKEYSLNDSKYVRILGRGEKQGAARTFNWPNAGFEFVFNGSTASVYVDQATFTYNNTEHNGSYFTIAVYDGDRYIRANRILLQQGWNVIYKRGIRDSETVTVMVVRSSEPWSGTAKMSKLKTDAVPEASEPREKLIEFIGDSYTAGYANYPSLSQSTDCCAQNSDNWYSYTGFVARHYKADNNVLAYQGRGVYANRSMDATKHNMAQMFEYQDPYVDYNNMSTFEKHDFTSYQPDIVTVWLGTNDMVVPVPDKQFTEAYGAFLDNIRAKYPNATIICMSLEEGYVSIIKKLVEDETRGEANGFYFMTLKRFATTSHGHPDVTEGERIAQQLITKIDSIPNVWGDEPVAEEPVVTPDVPAVTPDAPLAPLARYTSSKVLVNGKEVAFEAYNIMDNNYFKLRDLAKAFSGSEKQFEVTWDAEKGMIGLLSARGYTEVGGELVPGDGTDKSAVIFQGGILKDGGDVTALAYNINGNNYFKLRDICKLFDIGVAWDGAANTISLDTAVSYTD